jgi:hypothetical protein
MAAASNDLSASVHVRLQGQVPKLVSNWSDVDVRTLRSAAPWRTFRSYKGQRHYSGSFWSLTERDLVIYESPAHPRQDENGSLSGVRRTPAWHGAE